MPAALCITFASPCVLAVGPARQQWGFCRSCSVCGACVCYCAGSFAVVLWRYFVREAFCMPAQCCAISRQSNTAAARAGAVAAHLPLLQHIVCRATTWKLCGRCHHSVFGSVAACTARRAGCGNAACTILYVCVMATMYANMQLVLASV